MATRTVSRTRTPARTAQTESDGQDRRDGQAPQEPPRPAIWLQVVLPGGASQPVGIALDDPAWEQTLDNTVTQVKLLVMRDLLSRKPSG